MALKWGNSASESGILRKNDTNENKEELLVFGYSCKLFRDDEKALSIDQGKHLIPWMGDESLKIDRYDCRGALAARELSLAESAECPVGWQQLTRAEQHVEQLCDEERYRALHCDEDEEEMYREEELKRLHMARGASYGQVSFNYDGDGAAAKSEVEPQEPAQQEQDEPFVPVPELPIPSGMPLPDTKKLNAIIEKTALFIASQGPQMEILLKAKQAGNSSFDFLSLECPLHQYYSHVLSAIREGRYRPNLQPQTEEQEKAEEDDHYLHPTLANAPSIPSIAYKPSADCAYSMLVSQIKGTPIQPQEDESTAAETDIAPPGTETCPLPPKPELTFSQMNREQLQMYAAHVYPQTEISKPPVLYTKHQQQPCDVNTISNDVNVQNMEVKAVRSVSAKHAHKNPQSVPPAGPRNVAAPSGLKLTHYYGSGSDEDSDSSIDSKGSSTPHTLPFVMPPSDEQMIIDKMASYVAKNGDDFEKIVMAKGDLRFSFLNPAHMYHRYYKHKRTFYERSVRPQNAEDTAGTKDDSESKTKAIAPVSFSIKKIKEPEPILPKPALPYESSSDEEGNGENSEKPAKTEEPKEEIKVTSQPQVSVPAVVTELPKIQQQNIYHIDSKSEVMVVANQQSVAPPTNFTKPAPLPEKIDHNALKYDTKPDKTKIGYEHKVERYATKYDAKIETPKYDQKYESTKYKHVEKSDAKTKYDTEYSQARKRSASPKDSDSEYARRKKHKRRDRSRERITQDKAVEISDIEDDYNPVDPEDFIDLTEDLDDEVNGNTKKETSDKIQIERKKRAAAFLSSLQAGQTVASQGHNTLASAMVKTLHTLSEKEADESRDRRKRKEKKSKRRRDHDYHSSDSSDEESRRSKKHQKSSRERHSKKSKKGKSSRDSRSHRHHKKSERKKNKSRRCDENSSKSRNATAESEERLKLDEKYKTSRKNDRILTDSLKELVKETRKDMLSGEPVRMAVDIFANDSSNESDKEVMDNHWEKRSTTDNSNSSSDSAGESGSDDK